MKEYRGGPYYNAARQRRLQAREAQVRETYPVDLTKVRALVTEYEQLLTELGRTPDTAPCCATWPTSTPFSSTTAQGHDACWRGNRHAPRQRRVVDEAKITLGDLYLLKASPGRPRCCTRR
jgi:hypothetical protein